MKKVCNKGSSRARHRPRLADQPADYLHHHGCHDGRYTLGGDRGVINFILTILGAGLLVQLFFEHVSDLSEADRY